MEQSITAAQFGKDREEFMRALGSKMNEGIKLASIENSKHFGMNFKEK